ncbi:hypothetical protein ACF0H5_014607 [Mactra antiquata]
MDEISNFRSRIRSVVDQVSGISQDSPSSSRGIPSPLLTSEAYTKKNMGGQSFGNIFAETRPFITSFLPDMKTIEDTFDELKNKVFLRNPNRDVLREKIREKYAIQSPRLEDKTFRGREMSDGYMRGQRRRKPSLEDNDSLIDNAFDDKAVHTTGILNRWLQQLPGNNLGKSAFKCQSLSTNLHEHSPSDMKERSKRKYMSYTSDTNSSMDLSSNASLSSSRKPVSDNIMFMKGSPFRDAHLGWPSTPRGGHVSTDSNYSSIDEALATLKTGRDVRCIEKTTEFMSNDITKKLDSPVQDRLIARNRNDALKNSLRENYRQSLSKLNSVNCKQPVIEFSIQYLIITKRLKISMTKLKDINLFSSDHKSQSYFIAVTLSKKKRKCTKSFQSVNEEPVVLDNDIYFKNLDLMTAHLSHIRISVYRRKWPFSLLRRPMCSCTVELENIDIVGNVRLSMEMKSVCQVQNCVSTECNGLTCNRCIDGYYLNGSCVQCQQALLNCVTCSNSSFCDVCNDGYYVQYGSCVQCQQALLNCVTCSNSSFCDVCNDGYYVQYGSCVQCQQALLNCVTCSNSSFCDVCNDGYYGLYGNCNKCYDRCSLCTSYTQCTKCEDTFYNIPNYCSSSCSAYCSDSGCDDITGYCYDCKPGKYGRQCGQDCNLCRDGRCDLRQCTNGCKDGYYQKNTPSGYSYCYKCVYDNCITCSNGTYCTQCEPEYFRNYYRMQNDRGTVNCLQCYESCLDCSLTEYCHKDCIQKCRDPVNPGTTKSTRITTTTTSTTQKTFSSSNAPRTSTHEFSESAKSTESTPIDGRSNNAYTAINSWLLYLTKKSMFSLHLIC